MSDISDACFDDDILDEVYDQLVGGDAHPCAFGEQMHSSGLADDGECDPDPADEDIIAGDVQCKVAKYVSFQVFPGYPSSATPGPLIPGRLHAAVLSEYMHCRMRFNTGLRNLDSGGPRAATKTREIL